MQEDFSNAAEYDYDNVRPCYSSGSGCWCDGYSRCSTIENFEITKMLVENIEPIFSKDDDPIIIKYGIDRLAHINKLYDVELYDPDIRGGYYGEEFAGLDLDVCTYNKMSVGINYIRNAPTITDVVRFLLNEEYGFLHPEIENSKFEIKSVPYNKCYSANEDRESQANNDEIYKSINHSLPIGIYEHVGNKYRILDGHNRYSYLNKSNYNGNVLIISTC